MGLPTIYFSDGPVGTRQGKATGMPSTISLASTFDPEIAFRHASVIGDEVKKKGNDVVYAPAVNMLRTPLNGRTFEYFSEDPFLAARMTVGWTKGVQSQGVIANAKHFAVNNQEGAGYKPEGAPIGASGPGSRMFVDAQLDERTLREIYLPQFEAAVTEGGAGSVMCAYNRVNGTFACEHQHLLEEILKGDWRFPGFVLTDYGAAKNTNNSLNNGLDLDIWPAIAYTPPLVEAALASSQVSMSTVDEHVRRILRTLFAFGFFDREAYVDDTSQIDQAAHHQAAGEIEEQGIVLLRNNGLLPLDPGIGKVAVIGPEADRIKDGGGSSAINEFMTTSPRAGIEARLGAERVVFDDGSDAERAAEVARGADAAVLVVGDNMTEGSDKPCMGLNCGASDGVDRDALVETVAAAQPKTVVVLQTGGPVLTPWREKLAALVEMWYPGQNGGSAIARVLFGDVDPGGRLPATFPLQEADEPVAGDPEKYPGVDQVKYKEGVFIGYRWFDDKGLGVAYPFGHGLSYTTFNYSDLRVESNRVSALVTNSGRRAGTDVAQLYIGMPESERIPQPPRQLKGFQRVSLAPGESKRVSFPLDIRSFAHWDGDWQVARGCYEVWVGRSSRDLPLHGAIAQGGDNCASVRGVRATTACGNAAGLRAARATPSGRGARLRFARTGPGTVDIDVFQVSRGRTVTRYTMVGHWVNRSRAVAWRPRRLSDGFYVVRYRLRGSVPDARRVVLERRGGRFFTRPAIGLRPRCGVVRRFEVNKPVFGGRTGASLRLRLTLNRRARVTVDLLRGSRVVRRVARRSLARNRAEKFVVGASGLRPGRYTVRVTAGAGRDPDLARLSARRL